jgi:1-aminocyclopropane-1-carboxylate deaminase
MLNDQLSKTQDIRVDPVHFLSKFRTTVEVLRLDLVHPVISGNKWFKLKEYLKEAQTLNKKLLLTFGGAYSNHLVATALAASLHGFESIGIVRGEKPAILSHTLSEAINYGMNVYFISREDFRQRKIPPEIFHQYNKDDFYIIDEGGYGEMGVNGAKEILQHTNTSVYTHIMVAVGTGTTIAGLIESSSQHQLVLGVSSLKNNYSLQGSIEKFISGENRNRLTLIHDYHFGGYAKFTKPLIDCMNEWYRLAGIPSDFVYTGKLFFAVKDMLEKNYFSPKSKILIIHSGGLQGNQSLPNGTLIF